MFIARQQFTAYISAGLPYRGVEIIDDVTMVTLVSHTLGGPLARVQCRGPGRLGRTPRRHVTPCSSLVYYPTVRTCVYPPHTDATLVTFCTRTDTTACN